MISEDIVVGLHILVGLSTGLWCSLERSLRPRLYGDKLCLYGEKLSRARGSPSLPSQLYRAFI